MPRYPHLFFEGPAVSRADFSSPRQGGGEPKLSPHDRAAHASFLAARFNEAWNTGAQCAAVGHADRRGVYLEFRSEPDCDLALKSLEAIAKGIRLQNVRQERNPDDTTTTYATVFVPNEHRSYFLRKVAQFAAEDSRPKKDGTKSPKNFTLVNSIGDVRLAVLESFWRDRIASLPGEESSSVEAWLNSNDLSAIERFKSLCSELSVPVLEGSLVFPERTVLLIHANRQQLSLLVESTDAIAELRAARAVATFFLEQDNRDQVRWVEELLARCHFGRDGDVAVLVLDHGINNGHRLLDPLLADSDRHTINPAWGLHDHHGHGTLMAGTAAYGDLSSCLQSSGRVVVTHVLESAKILPPPPAQAPKALWGHHTARGLSHAEIQAPDRKRIVCMAVTSSDELQRGRPSSWSGEVDALTSGYSDDKRRLFVISVGNVRDPADWLNFPDANITREIHDPAQAWNALTVGAYTEKTHIADPALRDFTAIAPAGHLSPFSSTSATWPDRQWPIKPDVLFEGGNAARGPNGGVLDCDDLKLLSTYRDPQVAQFSGFDATSAATAQAAWMAARIQAAYPNAWPETIRALIVHSAEWTEVQKAAFLASPTKADYYKLAKVCGYGVPNLERALSCAANSLSLIAQAEMQPFDEHQEQSRFVSRDMHLYRLPWPQQTLSELGELQVSLRATLSYFIEPSPGEVGWKDRYRYASHALRFELNGPGESEEEFVRRINRHAREDDEHPGTEGPGDHWRLGESRNVGSIHSDTWSGTAAELALSNHIAVHPAVGWWRERPHLGRWNRRTRYALVVSIEVPKQDIDIYTPVAIQFGIPTPVPIIVS